MARCSGSHSAQRVHECDLCSQVHFSASDRCLVSLLDRPTPPGRPDVRADGGNSVMLSWTEPDDDGGCKIGNYIVEYYRVKLEASNGTVFV